MKKQKSDNLQKIGSFFEQVKIRRTRLTNIELVLGSAWITLMIVSFFVEADLFIPITICAVSFLTVNIILLAEYRGFCDGLRCVSEIHKKVTEKELKDH